KDGQTLACATAELVRGAVAETLKYSTKPADMVADPEWFLELTKRIFMFTRLFFLLALVSSTSGAAGSSILSLINTIQPKTYLNA
ncbi:protein rep, partial [Salmonella enterica subsp. enterica serovar Kentucky]|nr:protein rep [Salmonella enterica subsp. enterica serovar Kentucky]